MGNGVNGWRFACAEQSHLQKMAPAMRNAQASKGECMQRVVLRRTGILRQLDGQYPACFYACEVFRIAYRDQPEFAEQHEIEAAIASASSPTASRPPS